MPEAEVFYYKSYISAEIYSFVADEFLIFIYVEMNLYKKTANHSISR